MHVGRVHAEHGVEVADEAQLAVEITFSDECNGVRVFVAPVVDDCLLHGAIPKEEEFDAFLPGQ